MSARRRCDRGSTPVAAVGAMAAAAVFIAALGLTGRVFLIAARADGTADLAALAAVDAVRGIQPGKPCEAAERLAAREGFTVVTCTVREFPPRVRITLSAELPGPLPKLKATAIAGAPEAG